MPESVLVIHNVTKTYPGVIALNDVSMEFEAGEVHALVGENGAGKSTIIKCISGAVRPDSGSIRFEGQELTAMGPDGLRKMGIEVVYQELNLAPQLAVYENIFLGNLETKGPGKRLVDPGKMIAETKRIFEQLGIDIDPEEKTGNLSVAYMQFVEIAKAISKDAKVLIMDEPTATLANSDVQILFQTIRKLKARGVTIIYVSHRMEEIFEITDRCTVMRDGHYITTVVTKDVKRKDLINYMVGREMSETYPERDTKPGEETLRVEHLTGNGVQDISFSLHRGEILGMAGLVGAGRTETAMMIFGAARVESGKIFVHGREVHIPSPRAAVNHGIGLIPEDRKLHGLILGKSIVENITFPSLKRFAKKMVIDRRREKKAAREQVDILRIKTPGLAQTVKNLSGGNQQKVVLAKWLVRKSDILIFDEPTRGVDVGAKQEIYRIMNQLVEDGKSIIMISSEMEELLGMSDRLIVLSEHRMAWELGKEEMTQNRVLDMASGDK